MAAVPKVTEMASREGSVRGGRASSREGSVRGGQDGLSEVRLRADSSAHGNRAYDETAIDLSGTDFAKPEGSVRGGVSRHFSHQPSRPKPAAAEIQKSDAWFVVHGSPRGNENTIWRWPIWAGIAAYFSKWQGRRGKADPVPTLESILISTAGAFLGILAITALSLVTLPDSQLDEAIPSFGASAVLIYAVFDQSPLSQPRNFVGGQILSAAVGCAFRVAFGPRLFWLSAPLAMSLSLTLMQLTRTVHPPGGATAFVAATRPQMLPSHGFRFMGGITIGSFVMLLVALIIDNLHHTKRYPKCWFGSRWRQSWWP